jgi:type III secretion protein T
LEKGYTDFLTDFGSGDYNVILKLLLLTFMRIAPITGIAPFLGAKIIPNSARVGLAIGLTLVFFPNVIYYAKPESINTTTFLFFSLKEIFIGFSLAFIASAPFYIVQSSGILIDYLRGSSMMMSQDPTMQAPSSPIGIMLNNYLIVLFYALDGPLIFFNCIMTSFELFPVNGIIPTLFFKLGNPFWQKILILASDIFNLSIELAAPAILAILMAEMFLGIANRLAPQVQISFLGMPLKSILGLFVLWTGWYFIMKQTSKMSIDWIHSLQAMLNDMFGALKIKILS